MGKQFFFLRNYRFIEHKLYLCHKWPWICTTFCNTSQSFPHSWLVTRFMTRLTQRVTLVEQELLTLPEHLSSPSGFYWSSCYSIFIVLCVCFGDCSLSFSFWPLYCLSFALRILITPLVCSNSSYVNNHGMICIKFYGMICIKF